MARTYTESELLEPVRQARKVMKRVRAGTLDIDKATDLIIKLLPLNPIQDPFAGTLDLEGESEGSDSSGSDSEDSSSEEERPPNTSLPGSLPKEPSSPELSGTELGSPMKRPRLLLTDLPQKSSAAPSSPQDPKGAQDPNDGDPPVPIYGDTGWAVSLATYKEQRGTYHRVLAQECTGRHFWEHGLQWKPLCASRLCTARILLQEPKGELWHKCAKC